MDQSGIKDAADALRRRIEYLLDSGITGLPVAGGRKPDAPAQSPGYGVFRGPLKDAFKSLPCGHNDWKGVVFGLWPLGRAAVVWGVPVGAGSADGGPFGENALAQLEKMLAWLAGELKAAAPPVKDPEVVLALKCPQEGEYADTVAAEACLKGLEESLVGKTGVVLMGPLSVWAFLKSADLDGARARAVISGGRVTVATYAPDEWIREPVRKKAAHLDLQLFIRELPS
jgi:hypothetical protein